VTDKDQLHELLDIEAIKQLKARYFRLMDLKQWEDWGLVFATDCVMEVPEADMVNTGRQEIVASVSGALVGARTCHHGHMPEIQITGDGTARGIWAMFDYVEWDEQPGGTRVGLQGYGHYREEYKKEDGAWRIARIRLERLRVDVLGAPLELPG
jgi:SnoaL-like domain